MRDGKRHLIQTAALFAQNPFVGNFFTGKIYQGAGKQVCVPGLNCYSCPAAGACARVCKMGVKVYENPNSAECIRCGVCSDTCPANAICAGFGRDISIKKRQA